MICHKHKIMYLNLYDNCPICLSELANENIIVEINKRLPKGWTAKTNELGFIEICKSTGMQDGKLQKKQ